MKTIRFASGLCLAVLLAVLACPSAQANEEAMIRELKTVIEEFAPVTEQLYRGAQPDEEAFHLLRDFGIRTVINFRHENKLVEQEREIVEALGMNYVSLPWRIQQHPREPVMKQFLEITDNPAAAPFFMHCRRGAERTGVADAVYRHLRLNQNREDAWTAASEGHHLLWYWKPFSNKRYAEFLQNLKNSEA